MTTIGIKVDDRGLARMISDKIRAISNADLSPVLSDVGEIGVADSVRRIQSTKVDPSGSAWQPWSAAYARSGRGVSLERKSGFLMGQIVSFVSGDDETTLNADAPYAARQQFGFHGTDSRGRSVDHPERPYLGLSDEAERDVIDVVSRHLVRVFEAA